MLESLNVKYLIIHCSDTADDKDLSARDIHKMHLTFGWDGIGYHKIIRRDGTLENGRPEFWVGAHTYGLNKKSLGVCLIGQSNFTSNQLNSLEKLLIKWKKNTLFLKLKVIRRLSKQKKHALILMFLNFYLKGT